MENQNLKYSRTQIFKCYIIIKQFKQNQFPKLSTPSLQHRRYIKKLKQQITHRNNNQNQNQQQIILANRALC